jgi:hypothetical protein
MVKENLVEDLTKVEEIILVEDLTVEEEMVLERNLTEVKEMVLERNLIVVEEIILEEDLTVEEEMVLERNLTEVKENQPTKMAVDEITRIILLINLEIRAIETVIENHHLKDSSIQLEFISDTFKY